MSTPQLSVRVRTPSKGYQKVSAFNRSSVVTLDDFMLISLGLVRGRESLGEFSFLAHKSDLERNRASNMKYLEQLAAKGFKEPEDVAAWQPLLPINDPPVINQISLLQTEGVGELILLNFSARSLWEHTQEYKSDKEINVETDPVALMRSSVGDQMALIVQIYTTLKPSEKP